MKSKFYFKALTLMIVATISTTLLVGCKKEVVEQTSSNTTKLDASTPGWKADASKPITFDWYVNFAWFSSKWGEDLTSKYITKKTGVSINFIVPAGNENEKLNTLIASDSLPDFITLGTGEPSIKTMSEGGQISALNELADKYDPYFNNVADKEKLDWYTQEDGNVYGFPNTSSSSKDLIKYKDNMTSNETFLVRKDMYEAIGSPDMTTTDGFLAALKKAKEMFPMVNGEALIPFGAHEFTSTGNSSFDTMLPDFLATPREKEDKLFDKLDDPNYITWLKTIRKANEGGLLAQDIFIDKRTQMEEKIAKGRYFSMLYQRSDLAASQSSLYANDKDSIYIAIDGPKNSSKDAPKLSGPGIGGWTLSLISSKSKDPERAIKFLSYLISEEGQKDIFLGEKGVTYETVNDKDQFKPDIVEYMTKPDSDFGKKYGANNTFWMLADNNMQTKWAVPTKEPFKQMEDWTKGKVVSYSKYDGTTPTGDSEEAIAAVKINELWGKTLPKLLMNKTDADFDKTLSEYKSKRESLGFDKVIEYGQTVLEANAKKLSK